MTTLRRLVDETLLALNGYGLVQPRATFIEVETSTSDQTWRVANADSIQQGIAEIEDELVFIESVDTDARTVTISPDGRGYYGTTAAVHAANTRLTVAPVWPRLQVQRALNEAIVNTHPVLFGIATETFTANPVVNTYELPADAESVLSVTADTIGPTNEQQHVRRYRFNSVASSEFTTGNTLTIQESVFPGVTITVTYTKAPSEIDLDDEFTVSGLRETAKGAVKYAACSHLLAYMDPSRLQVNAAEADEFDDRNRVGTAQQIANNLYARYEIELERERKRLRTTTPVPINVRTR